MNKFVLLCVIFWIINSTSAQIAKCDYSYQYYWTTGYKTTNASYYACNLDLRQANYNQQITRIYGQHLFSRHSDANVKYITNYQNQKLKTFSSIFCQKFPNLEIIKITDTELESIDEDSLANCSNLNHLILFGINIRNLPDYLLIRNSKLTFLRIQNKQLNSLPPHLFMNQRELLDLDLSVSQINSIPGFTLHPLVKLELLHLNNNKLISINPEWFETLQNLKWLRLDGNKILNIPSKCFASLRNLEHLFLYENKMKFLYSGSFDGLQNLKVLNLRNNEILDVPVGVFGPLRNLQELSLYDNKLTAISSDSFGIHNQLTRILLGNNKINAIDEKLIDNTAVSKLSMTNNICSQFATEIRIEIKPNLRKCFQNFYSHRSLPQQQQFSPKIPSFLIPDSLTSQRNCGKPSTGRGNIVGGTQISRGSFPWIAALVKPSGEYFCGGTLLSNKKVLTAAHCIQDKHSSTKTTAGDFLVLLGAHDLKWTFEADRVPYAVESVNVHPDWNILTQAFDADIAALVLEREVIFSDYIQPICMPNSNILALKTGVVVGFGKSEDTTKIHENIPKMLEVPIHSNEDCFFHESSLVRLSSRRTFCGGTGTGIGVCRGDSGGGLIVNDGSAYYIRGIVSSSLIGGPYGCDLNAYSVFTDVTKYIDWINGISTSRF